MSENIEVLNDNTLLTREYLQKNSSIIGEQIANLAKSIEESKGELKEIKDRKWWQKLTTNNTKDLAEAMLKQNEITSAFLTIIQGIIFLSMNNVVVLGGIIQAIEKKENEDFLKDNKYVSMAKDYLTEAIKSAQKVQKNEKEIDKIKEELAITNATDEEQTNMITLLEKELNLNKDEDVKQNISISKLMKAVELQKIKGIKNDEIIEILKEDLNNKSEKDKKQDEMITLIREEIASQLEVNRNHLNLINKIQDEIYQKKLADFQQLKKIEINEVNCINLTHKLKEQESIIKSLKETQENNVSKIMILENEINNVNNNQKRKFYFLLVFVIVAVVISSIAFFI